MTGRHAPDLEPAERSVDRVLGAVPPAAPPLGFRASVLQRIHADRRSPYEWPLALALALPSLAYLVWAIALTGADIAVAVENVLALSGGASEDAFFDVDGLIVLSVALLGIGALVGTHALVTPAEGASR